MCNQGFFKTVQELLDFCGVKDSAYIERCEAYSAKVDALAARLLLALQAMGLELPPPPPPSAGAPSLSQVEARKAMVRARAEGGHLVSLHEVGGLLTATTAVVAGFPVNGVGESYCARLLNTIGDAFADSMVVEELFRLALGGPEHSISLDISIVPGHFNAWERCVSPRV
jgi:hypothetical protein